MIDVKSLLPDELGVELQNLGEPRYRAKQLFSWLSRGVRSFDEMSDMPKALRAKLSEVFTLNAPRILRRQDSSDGTVKLLWELADGESVESVVMVYKHGVTVCVSTQVGCRMGCAFCASTLGGLRRNLTAGEILDQVIFSGIETGQRISNIVLMGIGEPLDNFDNVLQFLKLVSHGDGLNVGMRHISLSTCGLHENIDKLAHLGLQLTLSVSLHAPDDETRGKLMPVNAHGGVAALMDACRRYFDTTGRRISFEYALVNGVNDTPEHASRLAHLLHGAPYHVNLILLNEVAERGLKPSTSSRVKAFTDELDRRHVNYTFRRRLGLDIDAACGQLRRQLTINS
ncbi:MAG: 23S rRNA (adenine(2503)-C(2))-methyltransferase RlmN [Oscillospiraceae bacterium]|jgi:23S rRNA (adenine2503-C2)-methyltransferase|nr:23S rRNA (adenine(2503)-C(2))-methyltransferase RlmN [Oscillospiraceae bacterium]